jgi:hypothetical protein
MRKATRRHPIHAGRVLVSRLVLPHPRDSSVDGVQSAAVYNYISEPQTAKATERSKRRGVRPRSRTHRHVDNILSAHVTFSKPQALARAAEPQHERGPDSPARDLKRHQIRAVDLRRLLGLRAEEKSLRSRSRSAVGALFHMSTWLLVTSAHRRRVVAP